MSDTKLTPPEPSDAVFSFDALARMRRCLDISQARLAALLSKLLGYRIIQTEISQMELGKGFDWGVQRAASRYFRGLGWDADARGNLIFVRPDPA